MKVQVRDEELADLLARLAATDAMFGSPVVTIRDVSEATDASPALIARLLDEMRGTDELAQLQHRMNQQDKRIDRVEEKLEEVSKRQKYVPAPPIQRSHTIPTKSNEFAYVIGVVAFVIAIVVVVSFFSTPMFASKGQFRYGTEVGGKTFNVYENGIYEVVDGKEVPASSGDTGTVMLLDNAIRKAH